jgi:arylsulfatase A-like enzyme
MNNVEPLGKDCPHDNRVPRRDFLKAAGMTGAMAALLGRAPSFAAATAGPQTAKPNIVYILADDLGYGDVGCLNVESKIPTPNMDRIGREGMIFTDAHSGSAVCTPTRYGIMTGRYSWRSKLKCSVLDGYSPPLIDRNRMTVASLLKTQGYHTVCVGKWHLGLQWGTTKGSRPGPNNVDYSKPIADGPTALGFDYYYGIPASLDMVPYVYVENDRVVAAPTETIEAREKPAYYRGGPIAPGFVHQEVLPTLTRKAVECIDKHAADKGKEPLFLYFPLSAPHTPIMPTPEFEGKSKAAVYGDFVCEADWSVGQVLDALERNGMAENTLVIFTSDNGASPMSDFKKLHELGHEPNYHFRGWKGNIYEGGHRIPFVARWPKEIKSGSTCDHPICLTDLMATAAEVTGAALLDNAGEDSVSLLSALAGRAAQPAREAVVHQSGGGALSIRQGQWKLELCAGSDLEGKTKRGEVDKPGAPTVQLYDLSADIGEKENVQDKHPDVVERLTKLLQKYVDDGRSTPGAPQQNEGKTSIWGPGPEKGPISDGT